MALAMHHRLPVFDLFYSSGVHDHMGLIVFFICLVSVLLYHTQHQVPIYHRKFHKRKIYLYIHIFTGLAEASRYRFREFQNQSFVLPDALDVLSSFLWSWTSLELVKTLRRGDPRTTRPPYQAAACLRPVATLVSYIYGISSLYTVSVRALDGFIYARLAIFYFVHTPYMRYYSNSQIYAVSIPLASTISIYQSRVHSATLIFILVTAYITKLNEWVTYQSHLIRDSGSSCNNSKYFNKMISMLVNLGFVELDELRVVTSISEFKKPVDDEFVSQKYSKMRDPTSGCSLSYESGG
ncbi:hypothetical protein N7495_003510 [Penicillium taxi]|uniref:uncharacterized protein n=1 Tax=Penicillium taxi TaxID=168475 RepID=UPI002545AECF|nr:uncharacterized protein N7495_003510 [Penicillium taxi]KAJ5898766.1 hypothetical protein N7495_003510 [Penicillium taxi]